MPGYNVKLAAPANVRPDLHCSSCKLLACNAVQAVCGHLYCHDCLTSVPRPGGDRMFQCVEPSCGEQIDPLQAFQDRAARREIGYLAVLCYHHEEGCEWQGRLNDIETHLPHCDYVPVPCSLEGCETLVPKVRLSHHVEQECPHRPMECPRCSASILAHQMEHHQSECPETVVLCEDCGQSMPRKNLTHGHHQSVECPTPRQHCKFQQFLGCQIKYAAGEQEAHEKDCLGHHVDLIHSVVQRWENTLSEERGKLAAIGEILPDLEQGTSVTVNTPSRTTLEDRDGSLSVPHDVRTGYTEVTQKTRHNDEETMSLRQEFERFVIRAKDMEAQAMTQRATINAMQRELARMESTLKYRGTTLDYRKDQIEALELGTFDGIFTWKITEFFEKLQASNDDPSASVVSVPFFTNRQGYKMRLRLHPAGYGDGRNTHLSLYWQLCKGHFDAILTWPFPGRVTLTLVDQDGRQHLSETFTPNPSSPSFRRPVGDHSLATGYPKFAPSTILQEDDRDYVKNNTMFIKAEVDLNV